MNVIVSGFTSQSFSHFFAFTAPAISYAKFFYQLELTGPTPGDAWGQHDAMVARYGTWY
jgi:hypothetical protein